MANETKNKRDEQVTMVLEEYFSTRYNLPGRNIEGVQLAREDKTTEDIQDDIIPIMVLTKDEINDFLFFRDFKLAHQADGTLKWAIWRDITVGALEDL